MARALISGGIGQAAEGTNDRRVFIHKTALCNAKGESRNEGLQNVT